MFPLPPFLLLPCFLCVPSSLSILPKGPAGFGSRCQPVCLHFPWLDGGSWGPGHPVCLHTPWYIRHTHTLLSQLAARLVLPYVCQGYQQPQEGRGGGGAQGGEGPGVGWKWGWALGLSDSQMLPINFSGRHGAVRGESGTCTIQLPPKHTHTHSSHTFCLVADGTRGVCVGGRGGPHVALEHGRQTYQNHSN